MRLLPLTFALSVIEMLCRSIDRRDTLYNSECGATAWRLCHSEEEEEMGGASE